MPLVVCGTAPAENDEQQMTQT